MGEPSRPGTHRQEVPASRTARVSHRCPGGAQTCARQPKAQTPHPSHFPSAGRPVIQHLSVLPEAREARWLPSPNPSIRLYLFCVQPTAAGSQGCQHTAPSTCISPPISESPPLLAFLGSLASHPPFSLPAMWLDFRGAPGWGGTGKNNTQDVVGGGVRNGCKDLLDSSPVSFQFFSPFFLPTHSCITLQDTGSEMSGFTGVGLDMDF